MGILLSKGMAPLFAVAALGVLFLRVFRDRALPVQPGPVLYSLAGLAGWSLLSWFWSINPDETLKTGLSLAATLFGGAVLFAVGARLDGREKEILRNGILLGGAIGFPLIAFEFSTNAWLSRFLYGLADKHLFLVQGSYTPAMNAGMASTALFFWPWALALWSRFRGPVAGLGIAVALGLILLSDSDSVIFGVAAGAGAFALGLAWPRMMPWVLGALVSAGVLLAPMIPERLPDPMKPGPYLSWLSPSAAQRLVIWRTAVGHIEKKPVLGEGFDATRSLYGKKDRVLLRFPDEIMGRPWGPTIFEPIPLHPHNGILQVWLELGAVGALILLGVLWAVIQSIRRFLDDKIHRAAALGAFTGWLGIASISFGAWQSWWLASILFGAAFMVSVTGPLQPTSMKKNGPASEDGPNPDLEETGGPKGPEPTRYGDWERKGRAIDF